MTTQRRFQAITLPFLLLGALSCAPGISGQGETGGAGGTVTGSGGGAGPGGPGSGGSASGTGNAPGSGGAAVGTGGAGPTGTGGRATGTGGAAVGGSTGSGGRAAGTGGAAAGTGGTIGGVGGAGARTAAQTCARWTADRANLSEGTWSGNVAGCVAGDISADGRANALRLFNLNRWLADLPAVVTEASRDLQAQACALMMDANNMLSHTPPTTWTCYTAEGAAGASSSNISGGPGVSSVALYMVDTGNETTFGHRRIVLSNALGPIGLGSTGPGGASCMQNLRGTGTANKTWVAWPPPGPFPIEAYSSGRTTLSMTGWSIQTQRSISLTGATVTVTSGGTNMPMTMSQLTGTYGESNAIRLVPNGWDVAAGQTYSVTVAGTSIPISYSVEIISCP
jgi:uncharacterized protein YkwD